MTNKEYEELKKKYEEETERRRSVQTIENDIDTITEHLNRIREVKKDCFRSLNEPFIQYRIGTTYDGRTGTWSDDFRFPLTYELLVKVLEKLLEEKQEEYNQAIKEEE